MRVARVAMLSAMLFVAWWLMAWGAARLLIVSADDERRADVIFVLSGSAAYVERMHAAAKLLRDGYAPKIVLTNDGERSGWSSAEQRNPLFVERAFNELKGAGVPEDRIEILPEHVRGTTDEAALAHAQAQKENWRAIVVVTSAYHSRRACWIWRNEFGDEAEIFFNPVPPGEQTPTPATWWFYPRGWKMVAGEYIKMIYYALGSVA
ncbi:MAG: hypothetical protein NVSMB56_20020 [Pyrinomonadaceae bacterium]